MIISNEEEWRKYQIHNTSYYGRQVLNFAQAWANRMEQMMVQTAHFDEVTVRISFQETWAIRGATRLTVKAAIYVLVRCWKYGTEFMEILMDNSNGDDKFDPNHPGQRDNFPIIELELQ